MALSPSGTAYAFELPWSYKQSSMAEEANTTCVQQIQEFRASSEVLFAFRAKALFALVPLPWAPGDRQPEDEQHRRKPLVSAQPQSNPSNSHQPSILTELFGTESEQNLTCRSNLQKLLNPGVLPGCLLFCFYYSNTTLLSQMGVCLRQLSPPQCPVSSIHMHLPQVKYRLVL